MEFKDLVGEHLLSGVDTAREKAKDQWSEDYDVIRFTLDGITYMAIEDPSDGYRSYCSSLEITENTVTNIFPSQSIIGRMRDNDDYSVNDVIEFIDPITNEVVLAIGTHNIDDYYPYCVMEWNPQNLSINQ